MSSSTHFKRLNPVRGAGNRTQTNEGDLNGLGILQRERADRCHVPVDRATGRPEKVLTVACTVSASFSLTSSTT